MSQGSAGSTGNLAAGVYQASPPTYTDGQQAPLRTDATGALVTSGGGGGGDVNIEEIAGVAVKTGHGTAADVLRVELPTDGTGQVTTDVTKAGGTAVNATVAAYGLVPVGGWSTRATLGITTTVATYTTGQVIGGKLTLTNVAAANDQRFLLQEVQIACKSNQTVQVDVYFFTADPSASTLTNASALVIATADYDKISEVVHLTDWSPGNTSSFAKATSLARLMAPTSGTDDIFACIVARGSIASGTTSEMTLIAKTASV